MNQLITILGPTATGKTKLASELASLINGEIISADSRQVYRGMDIGTGKDIDDYVVDGKQIPFHLIDIHDPGYEYNIFEFQNDFIKAYEQIQENENIAILSGGSGMYLDSILRAYEMKEVSENLTLRKELESLTTKRLENRLKSVSSIHNTTDIISRERLIRAIEIAEATNDNKRVYNFIKNIHSTNFGLLFDRQLIRERITERLHQRLDEGMVEEVKSLLDNGYTKEQLTFYGLEYKYLTMYVVGEITYDNMLDKLNTAIHQFAKRQMTWYRRMEKHGVRINWIDGLLSPQEKLALILQKIPK